MSKHNETDSQSEFAVNWRKSAKSKDHIYFWGWKNNFIKILCLSKLTASICKIQKFSLHILLLGSLFMSRGG